ncbi:hypothetical protein TNCV_3544711 [Trichonephila clavipes]|nr:hypothetical protein TNCV_3544711 [Trichonephila clavipes]
MTLPPVTVNVKEMFSLDLSSFSFPDLNTPFLGSKLHLVLWSGSQFDVETRIHSTTWSCRRLQHSSSSSRSAGLSLPEQCNPPELGSVRKLVHGACSQQSLSMAWTL